jgi:cytochrome c
MLKLRGAVALFGLSVFTHGAMADAELDDRMIKLASNAGCFTCHSVESGKPGPNGLAPIGPAWQDVGARYHGQPKAKDALLRAVMDGTSLYASHWKNKISGIAMPPNAVAIKEADAKKLVAWILNLKK